MNWKHLPIAILLIVNFTESLAQSLLSPSSMQGDLAITKATWHAIHPGLYRYNTPQQIDSMFNVMQRKVSQPMSLRNFFVLLSQLITQLHCGHSYVSFYNNNDSIKEQLFSRVFLPFLFQCSRNAFTITHCLTAYPTVVPGDQITAINNIPTSVIIDSLLTVSRADGMHALNKQLDNITIHPYNIGINHYALFDIFFPLFFKANLNDSSYTLTVKRQNSLFTTTVNGISKKQREQTYIDKYGPLLLGERSWYTRKLDSNAVLLRIGDFATYNWKIDYKPFLDSIFQYINSRNYAHLIVDIRENEGGDDDARDAVLSYLCTRPIGCANPVRRLYRFVQIPDSLKQNLSTWDADIIATKTGYHLTSDNYYENTSILKNCREIFPHPHHYKGKTYLITDATNSSTTFIMAQCMKQHKMATIVGQPTGGTQQGINGGELVFFTLPNSGIEMDVPLIWQRPTTDMPDIGIVPHHTITTTDADIAAQRDAQVEYILHQLIYK